MNMTHKEALRAAMKPFWFPDEELIGEALIEELHHETTDVIRAYLDARGLVMVPASANVNQLMAGCAANVGPRSTAHGFIYDAMLAAAPDPFAEG